MSVYLNSFYSYSTSFLNEKILPNLGSNEQKRLKIFLVAGAALSCLAICYLIMRRSCFKATDLKEDENQKKSPVSGLLSKLATEKGEQENVSLKDSPSPRKNDKEEQKRPSLKEQSPLPTAKEEKPKNEIFEGLSPRKNDNDKEDPKRSPLKEQSLSQKANNEEQKNDIFENSSPRKNDNDKEDPKRSPLKEQSPSPKVNNEGQKDDVFEDSSPRKNDNDKEDRERSPLKEQSPHLEIQTEEQKKLFLKKKNEEENNTALIISYATRGNEEIAFDIFNKMKREGMALNEKIYISLIDAFVYRKNFDQAFELFQEMKAAGMTANEFIYTSLFNLCVENKDRDKAIEVFDEMYERGITPSQSMGRALEDLSPKEYIEGEADDQQCQESSSEDSESASPGDQSPAKNQRDNSFKGDPSSDSKESKEKNDEDQGAPALVLKDVSPKAKLSANDQKTVIVDSDDEVFEENQEDQDALPLVLKDASPKKLPSANDQKTVIADFDPEVFVESEEDQDLSEELLSPEEKEIALLKELLNSDALQSKSNTLPLDQKLEIAKKVGIFLEELNLEYAAVTDQQLEEVIVACPNLKMLNLKFCKKLSKAVIKKLPKELKKLDLSYNSHLLGALKDLPPALEELDLSHWISLKDDDLMNLPQKLNKLSLHNCSRLNDEAIEYLSKSSITILDLTGRNSLTFGMIDNLPKTLLELSLKLKELPDNVVMNWPKLKKLDLSTCTSDLTDGSVKFLPTSLEELNVSNCNQLTDAMVRYLPRNLKRLKIGRAHV